jgi:acetoin:2,6-dichlorophenolindophenol oxidoreductase subunit alpha
MTTLPIEELLEMQRRMLRIRIFDERVARLAAKGRIPGSVHTSIGQEAEVVGACMALAPEDYMTGNHRSHGHPIGKGASVRHLMAEIMGKATGVCKGKGGSMHLADFAVGSLGESGVIGSAIPIATGAAFAAKTLRNGRVCLCFFGDGAANQGTLYEAMNVAKVWRLPIIFLCENNHYQVTAHFTSVTSVPRIAMRAQGFDIPGITVEDGQDVLAVHEIVSGAVTRAREGDGPTLVEVMTYRFREHNEGIENLVGHYRDESEAAAWRARDPIDLFTTQLERRGVTESELNALRDEIECEVDDAIAFANASPWPEPAAAFEDLYSEPLMGGVTWQN